MVMDYLLIVVFPFGIIGAASATVLSCFVGGIIPIFYFARKNSSRLQLIKTRFYGRELLKSYANGSSEMMSNLSMSLVNMLYNLQLMKIAGENGVAAYGVIANLSLVVISIFTGIAQGIQPIISSAYGKGKKEHLLQTLRYGTITVFFLSVLRSEERRVGKECRL